MNTYTVQGVDSIRKVVGKSPKQTSGVLYVPKTWAGKTVTIILEGEG